MTRQRYKPSTEKKRVFELITMFIIAGVLLGISQLETTLFQLSSRLSESSDFVVTVVYFAIINFNVVLILALGFLIIRNITKLLVERRKGVIGSKLRTKLVVTLVFFALAPTALLFYVSTRFITTSFDRWFSEKVRSTMQQVREAGGVVYKQDQKRLESLAKMALQRISLKTQVVGDSESSTIISAKKLSGYEREYGLYGIKVYDQSGSKIWSSSKTQKREIIEEPDAFVSTSLARFREEPGLVARSRVEGRDGQDVVRGIAPIHDQNGLLVGVITTEERFETQILQSIETILDDFKNLKPSAQLIRLIYMIVLVVMTLLITFSAIWLGFYVARVITGPIQVLAEATKEVALGNYSVSLSPKTDDETGQLIKSFNQMTHDLQKHKSQAEESRARLQKTNEELERRRQYMEIVLRNITTGVISVDSDNRITSINSAAENLLIIRAKTAIGQMVKDGLGDMLFDDFWRPIADRLIHCSSIRGQFHLRQINQGVTLIADATRFFDENGIELGIVVVFFDATEQLNVQRVAAWREVARRIAHEIKNPITPIKLNAQRLLRRFYDEFEGQNRQVFESCIETILTQVDSLRDLVNEFSKFARLPSIKPKLGNVNDVILDVANLYRLSYPDVNFDTSGLEEIPEIFLDKDQMSRVFVNLITNALSALQEDEPGKISFRCALIKKLNAIRIEVSDNGCGILPEFRDRVLEPYFSTKDEGTGLGLAIVNQIISDHGGYLRISDNKPRGTTIIVELPVGLSA